jgi:hypothetical protein
VATSYQRSIFETFFIVIAMEGGFVHRSEAVIDVAFTDARRTASLNLATPKSAVQATNRTGSQGQK